MSERPRDRGPRSDHGSNATTFLALGGVVLVAAALLVLAALVNPAVFGVLIVAVGFGLIGVLQYLIWGWWLSATPLDDEDDPRSSP
jgi:Flp pilus assembly protein TadB